MKSELFDEKAFLKECKDRVEDKDTRKVADEVSKVMTAIEMIAFFDTNYEKIFSFLKEKWNWEISAIFQKEKINHIQGKMFALKNDSIPVLKGMSVFSINFGEKSCLISINKIELVSLYLDIEEGIFEF